MYYLHQHMQIIMLFYCTLHLFYPKLKNNIQFFQQIFIECLWHAGSCGGTDLGVWYTLMNNIGNTKKF